MPVSRARQDSPTSQSAGPLALDAMARLLHTACIHAMNLIARDADSKYRDVDPDFDAQGPNIKRRYKEVVKYLIAAGVWQIK